MTPNEHMARVYIAQARATPWPQFRSTLVQWARSRWHRHIRAIRKGQQELF